jgi:uncharacterized protein (DUF2164 family)
MDNTNNTIIMNIEEDIIIVTSQFGLNIAYNLSEELRKLNFKVGISNNIIPTDKLHIILFSFLLPVLPKNYILYQLEQINKSNYITNKLYKDISKSLLIMDYSRENISKYKNDRDNISYQMMPIVNYIIEYVPEYSYDVIFFGSMNEKRKKILDYLSMQNIIVASTNNIFGENLYYHLKKAKIILNLHYYDNALLETARLNEILKFNTLIISENSNLMKDNQDFYKDDVFFIENIDDNLENINVLSEQIFDCLKHFDLYKKKINKIRKNTIQNIYNEFSLNLKKNLISCDHLNSKLLKLNIDHDKILCICYSYNVETFNKLNNNFLNIIDYYYIVKNKDKKFEENINYKILCENLLDSDYEYISICSIDMVFPQNFNRIYNNIIEYFLLDKYDIFINLNQTDKLDNLNKNNIYNKIIYYKYDNIENIEIKSNFNIFSRKFASKYLDYYYYNHGQIDMKKLIKEYNLSVITAKI